MSANDRTFDELRFFTLVKERPGVFFGAPSLASLRDFLAGVEYAFSFCTEETPLKLFNRFTKWYHDEVIRDNNGYACWWSHILYISGNNDAAAFDVFFGQFESYLQDTHGLSIGTKSK